MCYVCHMLGPSLRRQYVWPHREDGREQQPGLHRDQDCPGVQCLPPRAHAHAPLPADMREVKGDDSHHACVVTSTIGLAYQTLTGPGISVSEPPSPSALVPGFCAAVLSGAHQNPAASGRDEGSGTGPFLLSDASLHKENITQTVSSVTLRAIVNWKSSALANQVKLRYISLFKNYRFTVHDL